MRAANILAMIAALPWGVLLWMGIRLMQRIADRHVEGYPSDGQLAYHVGVPAVLLSLILLLGIICNFKTRRPELLGAASSLAIPLVLPFLFYYTGGF